VSPRPINLSYASGGTALLPYHLTHVTNLMRAIKFGSRPDLAVAMGNLMAMALAPPEVDVLVPLPLRADRHFVRGYNQAERIAQGLHLGWGIPVNTTLIERPLTLRNFGTKSQASRAESDRFGIYGAYSVPKPSALHGLRVALVDDTLTTGSTLNAAAEVLQKKTRVAEVVPLTLAYAVRLRN
jgi:predicted amidophosphoribosyltransferase